MTDASSDPDSQPHAGVDTSVPHSARIWNYWLGGKDHFAIDRMAGDQYRDTFPDIEPIARGARGFLGRVVTYLAAEEGIRQFLDIGTGLPTKDNTHEVAQRVAPDARIVYVDNDPLVLVHARALLTSTPEGVTDYVDADLREPEAILAAAATTLDLTQPVGLMLMNILGHIGDSAEARAIVKRLLDGLASGSYLSVCDGTDVINGDAFHAANDRYNQSGAIPYNLRSPDELAGFFDGLELVEPGLVSCPRWRPAPTDIGGLPAEVDEFGGVGRKP